ncbi:MAG: hypothetical protein LUD29_00390, partial [Clostridia bacterium]|nr:hypothetical protein [Clostridia bacterium]
MSEKKSHKSLRWILTAVLAVVLCVCVGIGATACKSNKDSGDYFGYFNKVDPKGADPMDGSGNTNNINYIAYTLEQQEEWYALSDSQAKAAGGINNQQIWTDKYYKNGYMLTTQKSYSAFSKEAFEALFVTGRGYSAKEERSVYLRDGSKPKNKDHDYSDVTWGTGDGDITYLLEQDYYFLHGLFSDEISVFVINDETVLESKDVEKNSDGTYTQSFTLDPEKAICYYQYSMKNHGGLSDFPDFSEVSATVTFDSDYRILKLETKEVSKVKKGISTKNTTTATTTYSYPDMDGYEAIWSEASEILEEAESYFDTYYGKLEPETNTEYVYSPDASDVLMEAIGGMLTAEGDTFAMQLTYGDVYVDGYLYAAIDLEKMDIDFEGMGEFELMDWIEFAMELYEYAHIIVTSYDEGGNQQIYIDLLSGSTLFDIMGGKIVNVAISDDVLADPETIAAYSDNMALTAFMAIAEALDEESDVDGGIEMTLDYNDQVGRQKATVSLNMDGFEMEVECYITKTFVSETETTYEYELESVYMKIPSINVEIILTPDTGDKEAHISPAEDINNLELETLVGDLMTSVLDLSASNYINESYTFAGDLAISMDLDSLGSVTIEIKNLVVTVGDILGDLYVSVVGDLQKSTYASIFTVATASTIGLTWCGDYIAMAKDLETDTPTYREMTTKDFGNYILDSDADVSPLAWLLGTSSTVWAIIADLFATGSDDTETTSLYGVQTLADSEKSLVEWLNLGQYVSGAKVVLDGKTEADIGDMDVETTFGLTDDYWAFEINEGFISGLTAGYVNSATLALEHNGITGIGGIYVSGTIFSMMDLTLCLSTNASGAAEYDLFSGNL